ncbi:ParA family protein [Arthrobacter sp. MAHUQ-56]
MKILFANHKGGVGKTTITVQTAFELAKSGLRVGVIDLDPQWNASRRAGFVPDPAAPVPTISEAIKSGERGIAREIVLTMDRGNYSVDLLPSRHDLENRVNEAGMVGATRRLVKVIDGWEDDYDVILMDTPPNMGHLTQMGLAAADVVIGVTEAEFDGIDGINRIEEFVRLHAEDLANPNLRFAGIVVNKVDNVQEHRLQLSNLEENWGDLVLSPVVKKRIKIAEANAAAESVDQYEGELADVISDLAQAILKAAKEVR